MPDWATSTLQTLSHPWVVGLMFIENVFPPIPSELIMPLTGFLTTHGQLSSLGVVLAGMLGSVLGGILLNTLLKVLVDRPRPRLPDPFMELTSASFPSSHMASATLFYGFLAVVLLGRVRHRGHQMLIVLAAAVLVTLVGVSRLALGVHYLGDVLAGGVVSLAWLALCHAAVDTWRRTRACGGSRA